MPMIDQRMSIVIRPDDLLDARLSHPDWDQVQINDSYGKIRDYRRACEARENRKDLGKIQEQGWVDDEAKRVLNPTNGYDESGRRLYHKHANHTPKEGRALLAVGNGNLLSNLGIVGWSERTSNEADSRLWKVAWEDRRIDSGWEYSCFYVTEDLSTGVARFGLKGGTVQTSENIHGKLKWVTSGQPILWDRNVANPEDLIAETYDVRHIYRLRTTVGTPSQQEQARKIVADFTHLWVDQLDRPFVKATKVLNDFAAEHRLVLENRYLMNALGVDEEGRIYIVQQQGSMAEIAQTLRDRGATRAILLDQGGSVGTFYAHWKHCEDGCFIMRSRDLRPHRLCILVFEVADRWDEA
jgi:hypothetical protein